MNSAGKYNRVLVFIGIFWISLVFVGFFTKCAVAPTHGFFYTDTKFPGEFNPSNDVPPVRSAKGCQYSILGLFAFGNSGAGEVAKNSEIRRIATIDHSFTGVLFPVYGKFCTIVTGD